MDLENTKPQLIQENLLCWHGYARSKGMGQGRTPGNMALTQSAGYFDMGSPPHPLGKWTMALNLLLNSGLKSLVHSQRVLTDPPLIGNSEDE